MRVRTRATQSAGELNNMYLAVMYAQSIARYALRHRLSARDNDFRRHCQSRRSHRIESGIDAVKAAWDIAKGIGHRCTNSHGGSVVATQLTETINALAARKRRHA
jgi:hypothetical protein